MKITTYFEWNWKIFSLGDWYVVINVKEWHFEGTFWFLLTEYQQMFSASTLISSILQSTFSLRSVRITTRTLQYWPNVVHIFALWIDFTDIMSELIGFNGWETKVKSSVKFVILFFRATVELRLRILLKYYLVVIGWIPARIFCSPYNIKVKSLSVSSF